MTKWVSIAAGESHSLGIKSDGTLWAWGYNGKGQLGDGTTAEKTSPVQTSVTLSGWLSVKRWRKPQPWHKIRRHALGMGK